MKNTFYIFLIFLSATTIDVAAQDSNFHLAIKGYYEIDSLQGPLLFVYEPDYLPNLAAFSPPKMYKATGNNDSYEFSFHLANKFLICKLATSNRRVILEPIIAEPGDSVSIDFGNHSTIFSGFGAKKYKFIESLRSELNEKETKLNSEWLSPTEYQKLQSMGDAGYVKIQQTFFNLTDSLIRYLENRISESELEVDSFLLHLVKTELTAKIKNQAVTNGQFFYLNGNITRNEENFNVSRRLLFSMMRPLPDFEQELNANSPSFLELAYNELTFLAYLKENNPSFFDLAIDRYKGKLLDKLLSAKILLNYQGQDNLDSLLKVVLPHIETRQYQIALQGLGETLSPGKPVFNFSLPNEKGELVSLRDFEGKHVYLHFWFKGCFPCRLLYKNSLSKMEERYKDNPNIVFVSVSIDKNKQTWLEEIDKNEYTSRHSINLFTEGKGIEHEVCKKLFVSGAPSPFLIGPEGRLITANIYQLGGGVNSNPVALEHLIESNLKGLGN